MRECSPLDALSDILNEVPDLVLAFSCDGKYLFINRAAGVFLGADPLDVIGCHWRDLGYPEHVMEPLIARIVEVAETGAAVHYRATSSELRGYRVLDMSLTPLSCCDEIVGVLAIGHDISEFFPRD